MRDIVALLQQVLLLSLTSCCLAATTLLDLSSRDWLLSNGNGTVTAVTQLPAYPLEVLRAAGVVQDPLYRFGDLETQWVALDAWTFTLAFEIAANDAAASSHTQQQQQQAYGRSISLPLLRHKQVLLLLGGIDTFADVTLNGWRVLQTDNYHKSWRVPVKQYLRYGSNELAISIKPAYLEALQRKNSHPYTIPTMLQLGAMGVFNFARKPASDFGWDWGPAFAASGIHGRVQLLAADNAVVADAYVIQSKADNHFEVSVTSHLVVPDGGDVGQLTVGIPELGLQQQQHLQLLDPGSSNSKTGAAVVPVVTNFSIAAANVDLWWPVGYGGQKLYDVVISYQPAGAPTACSTSSSAAAGPEAAVDVGAPSKLETVHHTLLGEGTSNNNSSGWSTAINTSSSSSVAAAAMPGDLTDTVRLDTTLNHAQQQQQQPSVSITLGGLTITVTSSSSSSSSGGDNNAPSAAAAAAAISPDTTILPGRILHQADAAAAAARAGPPECSTVYRRLGFRTVQLVTEPLSKAAKDLLGDKPGWADPAAAAAGQVGPMWPAADAAYGPVYMDGQWGALKDSGAWAFLANPVNNTAEAIAQQYPHSGISVETPPGEQVIAGFAAIADGSWDDLEGESFYFKVNGLPIYMKGANLIPFNILASNVTANTIRQQLTAALEANMNMIRIWGGGMYQVEQLYDFCDEHGLLVWQEAMFACGPYPRNKEFLQSVEAELAEQTQRLSWHPSIAIWGGNNEIEASFEWFNTTRSNLQLFTTDFNALFIDTVRATVKAYNPSIAFVDSSPSNGPLTDADDTYIKRWGNPQSPLYGDVHYYNYTGDCEDYRTYPQARFISEFGFQSFPTLATYAAATAAEDWSMAASMTEHRQRHPNGTVQLIEQFKRHFKVPQGYVWNSSDPQLDAMLFESFVFLGHIQQLKCYEAAVSAWRRLRSQPQSLTMGVLYWQLNDIWAGASWSSLDYAGRWKPLHYAIKRMFAPVAVQAVQDGNETQVFVINDQNTPVTTTIVIQLLSLGDDSSSCAAANSHRRPLAAIAPAAALTVTVPALFAARVWAINTTELLARQPGCSQTTCYVRTAAAAAGNQGTIITSSADLWLAPFKDMLLPQPKIQFVNFSQVDSSAVKFIVQTDVPAVFMTLHTGKLLGHFSDDAITVHPCQPVTLLFKSDEGPVTVAQLQSSISAATLADHQRFDSVLQAEAAGQQHAAATAAGAHRTRQAAKSATVSKLVIGAQPHGDSRLPLSAGSAVRGIQIEGGS